MMRATSFRALALAALLLPAGAGSARAFNYREHCVVSNLAFHLAVARLERRDPQLARMLADSVGWTSTCLEKDRSSRSYGDLVARVDYAVSPADFYVGVPWSAADQAPGETARAWAATRPDSMGVPWKQLEYLLSTTQSFRAMHENADHFGSRALFAAGMWHSAALQRAGSRSLAFALVLNAFADHYLQDVMAPGHVRTPRTGLDDAVSLAMHDHYNRAGGRFRVARAPELFELLPDSISDPELAALYARACPDVSRCELRARWGSTALLFVGDDHLLVEEHHEARTRDNPDQALFLVLLTARSIADVLESGSGTTVNHLPPGQWSPYHSCGLRGNPFAPVCNLTPIARIAYGESVSDTTHRLPSVDRSPVVRAGMLGGVGANGRPVAASFSVETILSAGAGNWMEYRQGYGRFFRRRIVFGGVEATWIAGRFAPGAVLRARTYSARMNLHGDVVGGTRLVRSDLSGRWLTVLPLRVEGGVRFGFVESNVGGGHEWTVGGGSRWVVSSGAALYWPWRQHRHEWIPQPMHP